MKKSVVYYVILYLVIFIPEIKLIAQGSIIVGLPLNNEYCINDPVDTLFGLNPGTKLFYGPGITNLVPGSAEFDPFVAGSGTHTITYDNPPRVTVTITVSAFPSTTLAAFAPVCEDEPAFALSGGNPAGGTYSGTGVDAFGNFDPSVAGFGVHAISYTNEVSTCVSTAIQNITVNPLPVVSLTPFPDQCENGAAIVLNQGLPVGGTYTGAGVSGGSFYPTVSGDGTFSITYTYDDGNCINSTSGNIIVHSLPLVSMAGLAATYCVSDAPAALTGTPTNANGVFTGTGIFDNGDGTASFSPAVSGWGNYTITYTYTDINSCVNSTNQSVKVGTELILSGLDPAYCVDETNVSIVTTPGGGTYTALPGLTDLGGGMATFDPSTAGTGIHTIEYSYNDLIGCLNVLNQDVEVVSLPAPAFVGLASEYCTNAAAVTLTGNYIPSGTFSGSGITDNGNGTASFDPTVLAVGGPYNVTYTYNSPAGCSAFNTRQTNINPLPTATIGGSATICSGDVTPLSVTLTGTAPYDFSYSDGILTTNIVAHPTDNYAGNVSPASTSTYTVTMVTDDNGCLNTGTGSAVITVNPQVSITTHPVSKTVCPTTNTSFSVTAAGVDLTYQWQKGGVNIGGAIASVLNINNVTVADVANYTCIVSSTCGLPVTSNGATLSLYIPTNITTHPLDDYLCTGENLNLLVVADGSNLTYQWRKDGVDLADDAFITGSATSVLNITGIATSDAGSYTCFVTGNCGIEESDPALVQVDAPIIITTQPANKLACENGNISFVVAATGTNLNYQWQKGGVDLAGETSQSLIINSIVPGDAETYRCIISSPCGATLNSQTATLTVNLTTDITTEPIDVTECIGENASLNVVASGSSLNYQWYKDGVVLANGGSVSGTQTNILLFTGLVVSDAGEYYCEVSGLCGTLNSLPADLIVDDDIAITTQPLSQQACEGNNIIFTVSASGSNLSYQWQKNGVNIGGAITNTLTLNSLVVADAANYRCVVSNSCGSTLNSNTVSLTINPATEITLQPIDEVECLGNNVNFSVTATGTNITYQWFKDGFALVSGGDISGALSAVLNIANLEVTDAGNYYCYINGSCGDLNSDPSELTVNDNIVIVTQPLDQQVCEGDNLSFSVIATGSDLSYQWQLDGVNIAGATNAVITLNSVDAADAGGYRCVVTNACGSIQNSQTADLTLYSNTTISLQPLDDIRCIGENTSFVVNATGDNLSYQWKKNSVDLVNGGNISGTLTNTLNITGILAGDAGVYTCEVTGSCGLPINSDPANLVLRANTAISVHPSGQTECEGGNAVFNVTAAGSNLTYQWQKGGASIGGATNSGYIINNVMIADAGIFRCIVTGDCGVANSNGALLTINEDILISSQPVNDIVCENETAGFSISVTGTSPSYQWRLNGIDLADGGSISGANTQDLTINPTILSHNGTVSCLVTGTCGSETSTTVMLTVNEDVAISVHPQNNIACPGENVLFNLTAAGSGHTFQWQKDGANIAGETNSALLINNVTDADEGLYRCVVTGTCNTEISNAASLTVNEDVSISADPADQTVCEGNSAGFSIMASGTGLTYQWKRNGTDLADGGTISGSTTNNLVISSVLLANAGSYICEVSGTCGTVNSATASLTINENINITTLPQSNTACPGDDVVFSISATGTNLSWQWQKNGIDLPGETSSGLLLNAITSADAGSYRCVLGSDCGTLVSAGAILTVNSDVLITAQPSNAEVCDGSSAGFMLSASGTGLTYQWRRNNIDLIDGGNINGANTNSLSLNPVSLANAGVFTCEVTGTCGTENSSPADLVVDEEIAITAHPDNLTACPGENANFSVLANGTNLTYQWQKDGVNIAGEVASGLSLLAVDATDQGIYRCVISGDCGTLISNGASLTINQSVTITAQPAANPVLYEGDNLNLNITATGTSLTWQWQKEGIDLVNGGNISGSQGNNLIISGVDVVNDGIYNCIVTGTCGSQNSSLSDVMINPATTIITHPVSYTIVEGGDALFSVVAEGGGLTYQWQKDGTDLTDVGAISGSLTSTLNITGVVEADEGAYRCVVTGSCNSANSNPANLVVNPTTNIITQPISIARCVGESAAFTILAGGSGNTYQWRKDGVDMVNTANISGVTTANLNITSVTIADAGAFTCIVNTESSAPAILTVNNNTSVTIHPAGSDRCEGDIMVMNISASGSSLTYQWQAGGVNLFDDGIINGSGTPTLSISPVSISHTGNYRCVVTGICGAANSNPATLTVYENTLITTQPSGATICEGNSHTFSVVTEGNNLTFLWKKNGTNLGNGGNISGATTADLTVANVTLSDAGSYTCTVTGQCGFETSNIAQLTVNANTTITLQPVDQQGCNGDNISFSVLANGSALTCQWQRNGVNISDAGSISGSSTPNLMITGTVPADSGSYVCVVNGVCGIQSSDPASLISYENTLITTEPSGSAICEGQTVTLQVVATGNNLTYQWSRDGVSLSNTGNITGTQTANLNISNAALSNAGTYTCEVAGSCGIENSNLAILSVRPSTVITTEPTDATGCEGDNISFTVVSVGHNLTYQWQKDGANLADIAPYSGSGTNLLSITGITPAQSGSYRCVVTGTCGVDNSNPALLSSYQNTIITLQPLGTTICEGNSVTLNLSATGDSLSYQWKKGGVNLTNSGNISGVNTSVLTIGSALVVNSGTYSCEVSGICGSENSSLAIVTVQEATLITMHPVDVNTCSGDNTSFSGLAEGNSLTYQWQKDGANLSDGGGISGSSSSLLQLSIIDASDEGSYRCVVTGSCGIQNSNPAQLLISEVAQITLQPTGNSVCAGSQVTLNITATGDGLTYQWKKDGVALIDGGNISGANTSTLLISSSQVSNSGIYTCSVISTCGSDNSSPAIIVIREYTIITQQPQNATRCEGDVAVISVQASGISLSYQWQKDGAPLVDGGNIFGSATSILTLNNLIAADAGAYRCVITGICGTLNSDAANLTVGVYPANAGTIIGPVSVCQGESNIIYEVAAINNADSYIWNLPVGVTINSGNGTRLINVTFADNEMGGNITVQGTNTCGTGTLSPVLTVMANPVPNALAGTDQDLCADVGNLSAVHPGTANGAWSVLDGPAIVQTVNLYNSVVTNLRQGSNTFIWTVSQSGCSSSDTVIIRNNYVAVEAGTDVTICTQSVVLQGSDVPSGANESWSATSGSASFINGIDPVTTAYGFAPGINVLRWTVTNANCINYDSVIINNQVPTNAYAGIDQSICRDYTALGGNNPGIGSGIWTVITGSATFSNNNISNTNIINLAKGSNILRWTITNGICTSIDEVTINNNLVNIYAGVDQVLCDRTTDLAATAPTTGIGNWSVVLGSAAFVNNNLYNTRVTGLAKGENILAWNINNNGCISRDTVSITDDSPTDANAGNDEEITADFTTLQGNNPVIGSGIWSLISGSAVIANPTLYNTNVTSLGLGDNTFRWTISHNSCISEDDVIITNFMSTQTDAGEDQTICSSETTLDANKPVFGFGEWSVVQGAATFANINQNNTTVSGLAQGDNILRWTVWENGYTSDDVIITNDTPTQSDAGGVQTLCSDSAMLSANDPIIGTGHWTVISGAGQFNNDTVYNTQIINLSKGQNILKWTITNKSCNSSDNVIINNDLPTNAYAGEDQILCTDSTRLNPNTPSVGTGSWSVIGGSASFNGNMVENLAQGNNTLRWTITRNNCQSYDDILLINNRPTRPNAGADKTICADSIVLAANAAVVGTGVWTTQNGSAAIANINSPTSQLTQIGLGINVFRWTISNNGCILFDEVVIKNSFIEAIAGTDQDICSETTVLEASNAGEGTGTWTVLGGSGAAVFEDPHQPDTRVNKLEKGSNILRWTIVNDICSSVSDVTINNNLPTVAFAGPDQALCKDSTYLQGNTPVMGTGQWSVLSGSANIQDVLGENSRIVNLDYGVNTLRWTITNQGCSSADEVAIINNSAVASDAGTDQTICSSSTYMYANNPPFGTGQWSVVSGSATFGNNANYNTDVIDLGNGTNILRWVISNGNCSSSDMVTIINNSPTTSKAGADISICGDSTSLKANVPVIGNGQWSLVSGAVTFSNSTGPNSIITDLNPGQNVLRWTISYQGCTSVDEIIVSNDLPYVANAGQDLTLCGNETDLLANDPVSGIGQWSLVSGAGTFTAPSVYDTRVTGLGPGNNTLRWTITYDKCITSDEITITNNQIQVYAGIDQIIGKSETLLAANNPSSGSGEWLVIGGAGTFSQPYSSITQVNNLGGGLNTFRWTLTLNGCVSYDDVSVTYNVPPEAGFVISANAGCPPLEVYFVNNSMDNLSFMWNFGDGDTSSSVTVQHTYAESGKYKASLTVTGTKGELVRKDTIITVYDVPEASLMVVNREVYIPDEEAIFINTSTNATRYEWEFGDGSGSTERDPRHTYEEEGNYNITLHVWSDNQCYDSAVVPLALEVIKSGTIQFPNAFTPNFTGSGDGTYNQNDFSNDVFFPIGEGIEEYHLEVFNKWGILVFESMDISIGWDGYYQGEILNEGVYVWKVTGKYNNGKDFKKVGTVMLLH